MASSSSSASQPSKYDVFLNFRGEDTRRGFTSHLHAALRRTALQTFFDDDDLKRGEAIAPALPRAIQDSTVAVLVFSKDYASSSWCLDELAEIVDRHRFHGQIVLPVFYDVDPSHLRKLSDDVAAAFVKHEQNPMNADKIPRWKDALITAASLSGLDSKNFGNDDLLINKIVEDILEKLMNQSIPCDDLEQLVGTEHLVGMDSRIKEIKEVLTINPFKARILGIWGMGGIGKTTTAEVIYQMMFRQFQDRCILKNVRQREENELWEELILKIFGEKGMPKDILNANLDPFLNRRLLRKKVLLFLDDVNNLKQIESLIGDPRWFGSGSMILITSRNKLVFEGRTDFIYEVKLLNYDEALQLFSKRAFGQNYLRDDYAFLSKLIVKYAQGNPLALKVLGSYLIGKNHEEWESAVTQLSRGQKKDIREVLQISYDDLEREEKDIFLDIACFFNHGGQMYVKADILRKIYKSKGLDIDITLTVLVDKCLITSKYLLDMHDLLQEMGKGIVRQEAKYSYQRSRLWDPQDIYEVFAGNKEAEAVETITLDLSKIREMNLDLQVFRKMPNLRFLNFYGESNLHLSQGLKYLPDTLQYLRWDRYLLESLPPNFQPKNLVVLELPNSNIKLWNRAKEDSLLSIVNSSWRLTSLSLAWNKSITHLPNGRSGFLEALEVLDLWGCSNLNTFPEISSNIKRLYLSGTAIKQVPSSSIKLLSKLERLVMDNCKELESLPSNFFSKLTSLRELVLNRCSRFKMLPEILEPTSKMNYLNLEGTAIKKMPSFIGNFYGDWTMNMSKCSQLAFFPRSPENFISEDSNWVVELILSGCNLRELPEDLSFLSFITTLDLRETYFERIPATFKQFSRLKKLYIIDCIGLLSLPELPSNVCEIYADNCLSLKKICTLKQLPLDSPMANYQFDLSNCGELDEDECQEVVNVLLRNYTRNKSLANFEMTYLGSKISEWVKYQNEGDSIKIDLPSHWFNNLFLGFAFYLSLDGDPNAVDWDSHEVRYDCYFGDEYHFSPDNFDVDVRDVPYLGEGHMLVFISRAFCEWVRSLGNFEEDVDFFKFTITPGWFLAEINKCGVIPLYAQKDEDEFCGTFDFPNLGVSKLKRSISGAGSFHNMSKKKLKIEEIE